MRRYGMMALAAVFLCGCSQFAGPEEKAITELLRNYFTAISKDDRDMAMRCIMDQKAFMTLNPDASARGDAEGFSEGVVAELYHTFQAMVRHYQGRTIVVKKVVLGTPSYQYKPSPAFKDNEVTLSVDGEEVMVNISVVVRIGDGWRIVDLSGVELY